MGLMYPQLKSGTSGCGGEGSGSVGKNGGSRFQSGIAKIHQQTDDQEQKVIETLDL